MSKRTIVVHHTLGKEEALKRLKRAAEEELKEHAEEIKKHDVKIEELTWDGYTGVCKVSWKVLRGSATITVTDSQVTFDANVPPIPFFLKRTVEREEANFLKELETILSQS